MPQPSCEQAEFPSNFLPIICQGSRPPWGGGGGAVFQGTGLLRGKEVAFHFHTEKLLALLFPDPLWKDGSRAPETSCTD